MARNNAEDKIDAAINQTLGGTAFDIAANTHHDHSAAIIKNGERTGLMWSAGPEDTEATSKFSEFTGSIENGDIIEVVVHEERQNFSETPDDTLISDESRFETDDDRVFIQNQNGEGVVISEEEARQ